MENQHPKDGGARDVGREGSGSSMGKDLSKDMGKDIGKDMGAKRGDVNSGGGSVIDRAKDMAKDATKDLPTSSADINKTIDRVAEAAHPTVDRLAVSAHAGVDKVSDALAGATRSMDERTRQLTEAARMFADNGREYVRSSPATSVLAALGAGYLLAKILGSRR